MRKIDKDLIESMRDGNLDEVKRLLNERGDVYTDDDLALRSAVVKVFIENIRNVLADDDYALCWASENGHIEVVKVLLEKRD